MKKTENNFIMKFYLSITLIICFYEDFIIKPAEKAKSLSFVLSKMKERSRFQPY